MDLAGPSGRPIGVGTDLVDVERLRSALDRQTGLRDRLFTDAEWEYAVRHRDPLPHLAGRFAAKESVMKALGRGIDSIGFTDIEVVRSERGAPGIELTGRADDIASALGISGWLLSLTHTDTIAQAVAIALRVDE